MVFNRVGKREMPVNVRLEVVSTKQTLYSKTVTLNNEHKKRLTMQK